MNDQAPKEPVIIDRTSFLLESSRTSHEELMFRIKHRDDWMKLQLIAQATLAALAFGVEVGGVKTASPVPWALTLASPISFILAVLYCVEDRLIGLLSHWRSGLPKREAALSKPAAGESEIEVFEASSAIEEYSRSALLLRLLAQLCAFVGIPAILAAYRLHAGQRNKWELFASAFSLILTFAALIWQFYARRSQVRKRHLAGRVAVLKQRHSAGHPDATNLTVQGH